MTHHRIVVSGPQAAVTAAAAAAPCVAVPPLLLLQQLLLFVIVCRMAKMVAGSLNLTASSVIFLFMQTRFIFNVCRLPLGSTVVFAASISYTASSVITGIRGAKAGVIPPRRRPPCIIKYYSSEASF